MKIPIGLQANIKIKVKKDNEDKEKIIEIKK